MSKMTSILSFMLDNGNQMVVVGDTQHTHGSVATSEESKIDFFNGLLFCGSGHDDIIWDINREIKRFRSLERCSNKILDLKRRKIEEYQQAQTYGFSAQDVEDCQFMLIDTQSIRGNKVFIREKNSLKRIEIIGSGSIRLGEIQQMLRGVYEFPFGPHLFKKIIEIFNFLGRHDPYTGHPTVFPLEIHLLKRGEHPKKFILKFKPDIESIDNYEIEENDY